MVSFCSDCRVKLVLRWSLVRKSAGNSYWLDSPTFNLFSDAQIGTPVISCVSRFVLSGEASTQVETALEEFIRQQRESTAAKAATPSAAQETGTDTKTEVVVMTTAGSAEK